MTILLLTYAVAVWILSFLPMSFFIAKGMTGEPQYKILGYNSCIFESPIIGVFLWFSLPVILAFLIPVIPMYLFLKKFEIKITRR